MSKIPRAETLPKKIDSEFIERVLKNIKNQGNGRAVTACGSHTVNAATVADAAAKFKEQGYLLSFGTNSYGVKTMILEY